VPSITEAAFEALLAGFVDSCVHLEMRDAYGTQTELPHLAAWAAGQDDDLAWLDGWCTTVRAHVAAGRRLRRARIVSEPLSSYQRWSHAIAHPMVAAGEDIRWVPRIRVSAMCLPGSDFYLLDDALVVFLHYTGEGSNAGYETSTEPGTVALCRTAFEAVWAVAIPHRDYHPA
jgi:hypothetical protein